MPTVLTTDVCWLSARAHAELLALAKEAYPNEVGGIIAGYSNGDAIVVTEIVGPGPNAMHERVWFYPDHEFHVAEMRRIFDSSRGSDLYLGDWHTHPNGPSALSRLDKQTLRAIACAPEAQCAQPLMLLLSGGPEEWELKVSRLQLPQRFRRLRIAEIGVRIYQN